MHSVIKPKFLLVVLLLLKCLNWFEFSVVCQLSARGEKRKGTPGLGLRVVESTYPLSSRDAPDNLCSDKWAAHVE